MTTDNIFQTTRRQTLCAIAACAVTPWSSAAPRILTVGQVASLSGRNGADLGQGLKHGIEACFASVNAAGGIRGQSLRLVSKDDRYEPDETVRLTRELIAQERPIALIGYRGTANTLAMIQSNVLVRQGITLVGTLTGAKEVQGAPGVLHLRTSYEEELAELVKQVQRMSLDRVAVLFVDDAFGRTGLVAVEQAALAAGQPLVKTVPLDKTPANLEDSIRSAVKALAAASAKALIIVAVGEPVYAFLRAFRPANPATQVFCMSVVDSAAVIKHCGTEIGAGMGFSQVYPFPYGFKTVLVQDYRRALGRLADPPQPNYFSLEGYVYARVLVEALKHAVDAPSDEQVSAALQALAPINLGGLRMQIDPRTRNGMHYTDLTVLTREGRLRG